MQSDRNRFYGDVVLDSINKKLRDEVLLSSSPGIPDCNLNTFQDDITAKMIPILKKHSVRNSIFVPTIITSVSEHSRRVRDWGLAPHNPSWNISPPVVVIQDVLNFEIKLQFSG